MRKLKSLLVMTAVVFTVVLPAAATSAATPGARSFAATYPVATSLCVRAYDNGLRGRLKGQEGAVLQACLKLRTAFTTAQGAADAQITADVRQAKADIAQDHVQIQAALQTYRGALTTAKTQLQTAITKARADGSQSEKQAARLAFRSTVATAGNAVRQAVHAQEALIREQLQGLRGSSHTARLSFVTAVQTARKQFWAQIGLLRIPPNNPGT